MERMGIKRHHSMREDCRHEDSQPQHSENFGYMSKTWG